MFVRPDGWVYMSGGCAWCKWTVMPMAVTLVVMHSVVQVCTVSVMHGHITGRSQISVSVSVTLFMVDLAVGPRAATITLSRNCDGESVLPVGVSHKGCPRSVKWSLPKRRMRSIRCLTPHTERRSAACALKGPPMGIAPCLSHTRPDACVNVSVMSEK